MIVNKTRHFISLIRMDVTAIFKQVLDNLRQKNKELALINSHDKKDKDKDKDNGSGQSKIFPKKKAEYSSQANELSKMITSLRDHLIENRESYFNIGGTLGASSVFASVGKKGMTDVDRDMLDNDVQKIIHNCQKAILDFESMIEKTESIRNNLYLKTHLENVSESLSAYLKQVTAVFSEMRAIRVKRTVDYQNMSRLTALPKQGGGRRGSVSSISSDKDKKHSLTPLESEELDGPSKAHTVPDYFLEDGEIPPEELQLLEEENAALLNQLNSLAQEVDQIQSNVVQIAQLQEIFTEKVLQQEKEIDKISSVVVGATENIKGGNEQIRQAIQNNADFRVWVLFFIIVMSFSLLFLDWYNE